jgi:hypothetical protein
MPGETQPDCALFHTQDMSRWRASFFLISNKNIGLKDFYNVDHTDSIVRSGPRSPRFVPSRRRTRHSDGDRFPVAEAKRRAGRISAAGFMVRNGD